MRLSSITAAANRMVPIGKNRPIGYLLPSLLRQFIGRQFSAANSMKACRSVTLILVATLFIVSGCAYTLDTGNRNIDGGCHCIEKITAPVVKAVTYTAGGVLALTGAAAANSDEICSDELVPKDRDDNDNAGEQHGDDPSPPQPEGKPLR